MNDQVLLDLSTDLGYELAMSGAETYRVEESVTRLMAAYGVEAEVFATTNFVMVTVRQEEGTCITRMRRIGHHGNDMDSVEQFSALSRAICSQVPEPSEAVRWLEEVRRRRRTYSTPMKLFGDFVGAAGFAVFFGGGLLDGICGGICGMLVGFVDKLLDGLKVNPFFRTISSSYLMALLAYFFGAVGIAKNPDMVTIGALMILVPGLLFTNAMRDIIYGDTNSGINRIVQVFLVAAAICLGTATAWNTASLLWGTPVAAVAPHDALFWKALACFFGCYGFAILFNIHGPGVWACAFGGLLTWAVYRLTLELGGSEVLGNFTGAVVASLYSETMARIRKYPAISYLVVSIFPQIPGAGIYYTMNYAVRGDMEMFSSKGMLTIAVAGIIAVGVLLVSTSFRLWTVLKSRKRM